MLILITLGLTLGFVAIAIVIMIAYAAMHHGRMGQHVSANPYLRKHGVRCVQSQDAEARSKGSLGTKVDSAI